MADASTGMELGHAVVLLGAAVVAAPLFRNWGWVRCWGIWPPGF
ncbi:hypothetical protein [Brevundimonas denitrificans]|nr:hypothetical protein [Brevundimonas denitrificans]